MSTNACVLPFSINRDIVHAKVKKGLTLPAIEQFIQVSTRVLYNHISQLCAMQMSFCSLWFRSCQYFSLG